MKRPAGVAAAAIVCGIGSAFAIVASIPFAMIAVSGAPPVGAAELRAVGLFAAGVMLVLGVLGVFTTVGLLRLRPWARTTILVISGLVGAFSLAGCLATAFLPAISGVVATEDLAQLRRTMAVVYGIPLLVSVWWLIQFTRPGVKAAFGAEGQVEPSGRPLMISIIGWFNIAVGVPCLAAAIGGADAFVAGAHLSGPWAAVYWVFSGGISTFLGWQLLKLDERARVLTIWWFVITILHSAYVTLNPAVRARLLEVQEAMRHPDAPPMPFDSGDLTIAVMVITILLLAGAIWPLVTARSAFGYGPPDSGAPGEAR